MQAVGRYAFVLALTFAASALAAPLGPGVLDAPEQTPPATAPPVALPPPPPPAPLTLEQLSAQIDPTIVTLSAEFGLYGVAGTGFVVDPDGLVLTNFHVVEEATDITAVHQGNGLIYDASVLGYDRTRDLAVLQLANASNLQVAAIGTSANVAVGDPVTAVGNADGAGALVPAPGKIVALDRSVLAQSSVNGSRNELTGMIQIDADVRSGDAEPLAQHVDQQFARLDQQLLAFRIDGQRDLHLAHDFLPLRPATRRARWRDAAPRRRRVS